MRIVRIVVKNLRAIKSLTFHPSEHNVIIGQVNAGKSTLLSALALALDPDIGRRFPLIDEADFFGMQPVDQAGNPTAIEIEVTLAGCSDGEKRHFLEYWEPWDHENKLLVENAANIGVLDDPRYEFAFRIGFRAEHDPDEDEISCHWHYPKFSVLDAIREFRSCGRADRLKIGFFLIPAERDVRQALSFTRHSALDKALRADEIRLDAELKKIIQAVKGTGTLLFDNEAFAALLAEMEAEVDSLLRLDPNASHRLSFELSGLRHYELMNVLRGFIAVAGQDQPYPIASQGAGAKQILVLAALRMLSKRRQSTILAMEEPEIGLHPHMQRSLVERVLQSSSQTFITTHSVHVAQSAERGHIFCLLEEPNGVRNVVPAMPATTSGCSSETTNSVSQVASHYPSDIIDAMFAPSVLLVEGKGDREALPALFKILHRVPGSTSQTLDGLGIAVLPCESKQKIPKVAPYFRSQLGKRVFALVDNEPSTAADTASVVANCDCTFVWPHRVAIEKVLLSAASDVTVDRFIQVETASPDHYFAKARTASKDAKGRRQDVMDYVKREGLHRPFAESLPPNEIGACVSNLIAGLQLLTQGVTIGNQVLLSDQPTLFSMPLPAHLGVQLVS